ncbi:MAG TPA: cupin domain-containing protein [Thermoflexia bacterium]|nr:cupin domain-containing protein [Thermoflexia bacterium]
MSNQNPQDVPWAPDPLPSEKFHREAKWSNINRAPHDEVSGVIYKRAAHIKPVRYQPAAPAPEMPAPFQGNGETVVRWLFSEQPGTEEDLLAAANFVYLHASTLEPGAAEGMQIYAESRLLYVIAGAGELQHHPTPGSPVIVRPLHPGDAALVRAGEYHRVCNTSEDDVLRLMVVGLSSGLAVSG